MLPAKKANILALENEIARASTELAAKPFDSEEYDTQLERISKLYKIKADGANDRISKETALVVGANILGILLIIRHEHVNVITSRAMGMLTKPKQV